MQARSTRLRYISSKDELVLAAAVDRLAFKVEIKSITVKKDRWYCWFVIPDVVDFASIDLD